VPSECPISWDELMEIFVFVEEEQEQMEKARAGS